MTFSDFVTIVVTLLLAWAVLVAILPTIGLLLVEIFWFAINVGVLYLMLMGALRLVNMIVRFIKIVSLRSLRA